MNNIKLGCINKIFFVLTWKNHLSFFFFGYISTLMEDASLEGLTHFEVGPPRSCADLPFPYSSFSFSFFLGHCF